MIELDDGFSFGIGAFETIAVKDDSLLFIDMHLKRLHKALDYFGISKNVTAERLNQYIVDHKLHKGVLKVAVSEKNIVIAHRENLYTKELYKKGFRTKISNIRRNESSPLTYFKTLNYADNIIAKKEAVKEGYDEVLLCNSKGELCEGSSTNIFFVKNGVLYTPSIQSGILPGIIRAFLCEKEKVVETKLHSCDISKFEECFVTNSVIGIMNVNAIDQYQFSQSVFVKQLQMKYQHFY